MLASERGKWVESVWDLAHKFGKVRRGIRVVTGIRASVDSQFVWIYMCWGEPPTTVKRFRVASIMQNGVFAVS